MISKSKADYTENAKKDFCKDCTMSRREATKCKLVEGDIKPNGHCDYFEAKNKLPTQ